MKNLPLASWYYLGPLAEEGVLSGLAPMFEDIVVPCQVTGPQEGDSDLLQ